MRVTLFILVLLLHIVTFAMEWRDRQPVAVPHDPEIAEWTWDYEWEQPEWELRILTVAREWRPEYRIGFLPGGGMFIYDSIHGGWNFNLKGE